MPEMHVVGDARSLQSALGVERVATASVSVALMAGARAAERRKKKPVACEVVGAQVAAAMLSERRFVADGQPAGMGFAPLSRFWATSDGWVRTHANYGWHRRAMLQALGVHDCDDPGRTVEDVAAVMAGASAQEVEERVFGLGGIAVRVRSAQEWGASAQGRAVSAEGLVGHRIIAGAPPHERRSDERPAGGVRVLDLTRVIAGPVATRFLGAMGADVLRLDGSSHPDLRRGEQTDTLLGKRSAELDFTTNTGLVGLHALLAGADVMVCGYRPGALDNFGLGDDDIAHRYPGLVVVRLAAWGHAGDWSTRRGFDSIVQAATGIAVAEGSEAQPGVLPCQLLDHSTGYLAAAAALDGLRRQEVQGGTHIRTVSLARTAQWLLDSPAITRSSIPDEVVDTASHTSLQSLGAVSAVAPPGSIGGVPLMWPETVGRYLSDEPMWTA